MVSRTGHRYSGLAMTLHWLVAVAVIANWRIAEAAEHAATDEAKNAIMGNHFAIGILIFLAVSLRLAWRATKGVPAPQQNHAGWEKTLAKLVHYAFYVLLFVMPLAGWYAMSKYGSPIDVWGVFTVPPLPVGSDPEVGKTIFEQHALAGTVLLILVAIHVLATLKHTFIDRDGNIFRMLPFGSPKA